MKKRQLLATALLAFATAMAPPPAEAQTATSVAPEPAQLTAEQWREDLRFMAAEMERRHHNLYHTVSRERFQAAVADLHARIPSLQRNQIIVGMMRIAAMVGDGHTRLDPRKDPRFAMPSLPLRLYLFEDGLFIRAADPDHAALVGARIEAIGGVPVEEAISRVRPISSLDNQIGLKKFAPIYLNMPDILHALELSERRDAALFTLRKGDRRWTVRVGAGEVAPLWPADTDVSLVTPEGWADARSAGQPIWLQAPLDYHRMIDLPDRRALYVQINMIDNIRGQTLARFGERIAARARETNPRAVVIDLRLAHGGNGSLRNRFVAEMIRTEDADTRLFVLTGRGTFSASQVLLDDLDRLTDAVFVGEPASSKPSSYGDSYRMPMPNSGISVRSSLVWWQSGQNFDPWTWVDVAAPLTFADYVAGRDPALEAAFSYRPGPSLQDRLSAVAGEGPEAVARLVERWRADPVNRWANLRLQLVRAAEGLHQARQPEAALAAAEAAARTFPDYADAHNVLAHLAEAAGKAELARRAGARVLELDPNNRQARSLIERLAAPK